MYNLVEIKYWIFWTIFWRFVYIHVIYRLVYLYNSFLLIRQVTLYCVSNCYVTSNPVVSIVEICAYVYAHVVFVLEQVGMRLLL